ncbi:MAG: rhodanese-related sulfurtransferase [Burkholderiaceae bacterium]|nr:rhodanese-related sulfurtransferase [Rhodoferax sp.]MCP5260587.1 rhodanese-related sulfurtransferase [Rhodoferax sp.]MCW5642448.1 rhodanese-related sulfurtransferase [Rhodoferax sp.]
MSRYLTAALYKFVELPDYAGWQAPLLALCREHGVKGTLLLAAEGINGTIAGLPQGVRAVLQWLRSDARMADLEHKESWADTPPFHRMKVRLKAEIVTMHVPGLRPAAMAGRYVPPQAWNALIRQPDVVVVDTRNDYEVAVGSFDGAVDPGTRSFSELPQWVEQQSRPGGLLAERDGKKPRVAMFCTGGIRCEKSTALLRMRGFDEVYHLQGGILKYLETVKPEDSLWQGQCFVFDERVSVGHGLAQGELQLCRSCRRPLDADAMASPLFEEGVSCPHCHDTLDAARRQALAERQRQVTLARARGTTHIAAQMPVRPARTVVSD